MGESKMILYGDKARKAIQDGINKLANAVKVTLGARGKNVVLARPLGLPIVTNDGVTIAKEIHVSDPYENIGVQLMQEVASKTNDSAGDGTTTATIIAQVLINEGMRNITAGANANLLVRSMKKAVKKIVEQIKEIATPIKSNAEIEQIATISANDAEIGKMIAKAMKAVGKDGVITIEEGQTGETTLEIVDGLQFDRGLLSPYLVNNPNKMEAVYKDAFVLLVNKTISSIDDLLPILEKINFAGKPFILIAENIEGQALRALVVNKIEGTLSVIAVKAPGYGDRRIDLLEDIAVLTGATVVGDDTGVTLQNIKIDALGKVDRVISTKDITTLIVKNPNKPAVASRIKQIKAQLEITDNNYDKEKLRSRLAKLVGGVANISVGAPTDADLKAKKFKVEDALNATRSAIEEGIVEGGGCALLRIVSCEPEGLALTLGESLVKRACLEPVKQIAENAGRNGDIVVDKIREKGLGYNAETDKYEDLMKAGIIDPAKVIRCALENAASTAGLLLTTETLIAEEPEKEKK